MIHAIRGVFIDNLKDIDWMDDDTRKAAKDKVQDCVLDLVSLTDIDGSEGLDRYLSRRDWAKHEI